MKSGVKFFLLLTNMFSSNRNDCIASTHNFRIVFILFSLETVSKNALDELKGNALKVTTDISSSLKLSSMLCCQALLRFKLKLGGKFKHICPKLLFLCCQFNMLKKS